MCHYSLFSAGPPIQLADSLKNQGLSNHNLPLLSLVCEKHNCPPDIPEIINPHTGITVAPNQLGELVLTTLSREAMPLIRYRTREFAILTPDRCSCGRTTARLTFIT
ncbi:phenylacetate--CoA ligase [Sporomusa acidovorans]|uniref:phenylacetate--CoA ligase n=1 Tax=Sporomusa acidovorans TaxID=112900 RepID=UPI0011606AF9|nr:phenylacetate--CoA ligase [Sporomusa acidovorans]